MSTILMVAAMALSGSIYTGEIPAGIQGEMYDLAVELQDMRLKLQVPRTDVTAAGYLVAKETDFWRSGLFTTPLGPHAFVSVIDGTVEAEVGYFDGELLSSAPGEQITFHVAPIDREFGLVSYRGTTLQLQPGDYILQVPEPCVWSIGFVAAACVAVRGICVSVHIQ
ncbi:MAG: hypothetical protein R3E01_07775 [Pirellulaceae bacterium]